VRTPAWSLGGALGLLLVLPAGALADDAGTPIDNLPGDVAGMAGAMMLWALPGILVVFAAVLGGLLAVWAVKELT
jgi:hypothetical protein